MSDKEMDALNAEFYTTEPVEVAGFNPTEPPPEDPNSPDVTVAGAITSVEEEIDPEHDRANWPTIKIEMEDGKPNYETLIVHGTLKNDEPFGHELQVMRGVEVAVPPSVVHMLHDAIATHQVPRRDPASGQTRLERQDRSAIPWHVVKHGKYIS